MVVRYFFLPKRNSYACPCNRLLFHPGLGTDEVRIAYVLNSVDLKKAMKCLEEALKVYPGRVEKKTELKMQQS